MSSIGSVVPAVPAASTDGRPPRAMVNPDPAAPAAAANPGAPAEGAPTPAALKAAVDEANRQLDQSNRELTFVFDDKLGRMLVKIVDTRTNTVIRQVPSEDMLATARALSGSATRGALLRGKA